MSCQLLVAEIFDIQGFGSLERRYHLQVCQLLEYLKKGIVRIHKPVPPELPVLIHAAYIRLSQFLARNDWIDWIFLPDAPPPWPKNFAVQEAEDVLGIFERISF